MQEDERTSIHNATAFDREHMKHALAQAETGFNENGVPIGAALVRKGH